jgi:outer membrane protein assembly factor BamE (lipoprotein component of BamABCDE complex)
MSSLDSDKVEKALLKKMLAERFDTGDWYYLVHDEEGNEIASTSISKGAKEILRDRRVSQMARQLRFDNTSQFVDFVRCTISRDKALETMKRNYNEDPYRKR